MTAEPHRDTTVVVALYLFAHLPDYEQMKPALLALCLEHDIKGTVLLAEEGINATVAGPRSGIDELLRWLHADPRLAGLSHKESLSEHAPFHRIKVKLKKEIVTMGVPGTDPAALTGKRVNAEQWNALLDEPDVLVIDTRNNYEVAIGTFDNAVSPNTGTFREFPAYVERELDPTRHKKIAMFCTGGIRCEKATNLLMKRGFEQVYHLDGGILKYLETVEPQDSRWHGECFVFDDRVAVDAQLRPGTHSQCYACRHPLSATERESDDYVPGVSCPHCVDHVSDDKKARLRERQRQIGLARARNEQHIGVTQDNAAKPAIADSAASRPSKPDSTNPV